MKLLYERESRVQYGNIYMKNNDILMTSISVLFLVVAIMLLFGTLKKRGEEKLELNRSFWLNKYK